MRRDNGWYWSGGPYYDAPAKSPDEFIPERFKSGYRFKLDHWQAIETGIVGLSPEGRPQLVQGKEPKSYSTCWNPRDPNVTEYPTLKAFMREWDEYRREDEVTVGVEFGVWTRGVLFRASRKRSGEVVAIDEREGTSDAA